MFIDLAESFINKDRYQHTQPVDHSTFSVQRSKKNLIKSSAAKNLLKNIFSKQNKHYLLLKFCKFSF